MSLPEDNLFPLYGSRNSNLALAIAGFSREEVEGELCWWKRMSICILQNHELYLTFSPVATVEGAPPACSSSHYCLQHLTSQHHLITIPYITNS